MQQKTLIALGALGAIMIAAWLTLRAPEKGQRVGPPPRPIAALKKDAVQELEITSGKDHVVLKRQGDWQLTAPLAYHADQSLVKTAIEQLEKVTFGDLVTENTAKFGDLEVSDEKAAHVVAKDAAGKAVFDAWIGKSSSGFTMLRPTGKNEVWQAGGLFKYTYAREPRVWRDHTVFDFGKDDVSKVAVESGAERLTLERIPPAEKNAEAKWKVIESTVRIDPIDDATANGIVQSLGTLRAADFADDAKPADVGLAAPTLKLTATVKGKPLVLLFGNTKGEDTWVQVEGKPQIYLLQKYLVERLAVRPMNFRDKTLVKAKETDLVEIEVTMGKDSFVLKHEGTSWKSPTGDLDEMKVKPLVSAFENLQAAAFADKAGAKKAALSKPTGVVSLKLRDKSKVALKIGALEANSDYYVQKSGMADLLLVKKYAVDRFLKKFSDISKTTAAAK